MSHFAHLEQAIRPERRDEVVSRALSDAAIPDEWFTSQDQKWLYDADTARYRLLDCLIAYFEWKHYEGAETPAAQREYLRRKLDELRPGDVVITTNWDTNCERTLFESGVWSPRDGYGFTRYLRGDSNEPASCPAGTTAPEFLRLLTHRFHQSRSSLGAKRRFQRVDQGLFDVGQASSHL